MIRFHMFAVLDSSTLTRKVPAARSYRLICLSYTKAVPSTPRFWLISDMAASIFYIYTYCIDETRNILMQVTTKYPTSENIRTLVVYSRSRKWRMEWNSSLEYIINGEMGQSNSSWHQCLLLCNIKQLLWNNYNDNSIVICGILSEVVQIWRSCGCPW